MRSPFAFLLPAVGLFLASPQPVVANPSVTILKPVAGATVLLANRPFKVAGTASSPAGITSIQVRVAGQTLSPLGTNRWKVEINIGVPGRYTLSVKAKDGSGKTAIRKRVINVQAAP